MDFKRSLELHEAPLNDLKCYPIIYYIGRSYICLHDYESAINYLVRAQIAAKKIKNRSNANLISGSLNIAKELNKVLIILYLGI